TLRPPPTSTLFPYTTLFRSYKARAEKFGPRAATVAQPPKIDNELYVRDYSKCILCYKCVEACGVDAQNTFAIGVAGRGFHTHIRSEEHTSEPSHVAISYAVF